MDPLVLPCPDCATLNRLPGARLGDGPRCATCKQPLLGRPIVLDATNFDRIVRSTNVPVVVDFWAAWCGPCRTMAPRFQEAAQQLAGRAVFAKVDTEAAPELAARFQIRSIPTLVLLDAGVELRRQSGALPTAQLVQWVAGG